MHEYLSRPINGEGGFQSLLRKMQRQLASGWIELSDADVERWVRYSTEYGSGGFEDRLRAK
jgi:hypothetical protein